LIFYNFMKFMELSTSFISKYTIEFGRLEILLWKKKSFKILNWTRVIVFVQISMWHTVYTISIWINFTKALFSPIRRAHCCLIRVRTTYFFRNTLNGYGKSLINNHSVWKIIYMYIYEWRRVGNVFEYSSGRSPFKMNRVLCEKLHSVTGWIDILQPADKLNPLSYSYKHI